jgi:AcrR family transcriptional regulator
MADIHPSKTYAAIIEIATSQFAGLGFHGVSVANLCRSAGVANGTFYLYFKNKEDIFRAVVMYAMSILADKLQAPERDKLDPDARDRYDVETMVSFIEERHDLFRVLANEHALGTADRESLTDIFVMQRSKELAAGVKAGIYRHDLHPEITAYAETGLMTEVLQRWVRTPKRFTRAALIHELCRIRQRVIFDL